MVVIEIFLEKHHEFVYKDIHAKMRGMVSGGLENGTQFIAYGSSAEQKRHHQGMWKSYFSTIHKAIT